jgi:hypothetical protein
VRFEQEFADDLVHGAVSGSVPSHEVVRSAVIRAIARPSGRSSKFAPGIWKTQVKPNESNGGLQRSGSLANVVTDTGVTDYADCPDCDGGGDPRVRHSSHSYSQFGESIFD